MPASPVRGTTLGGTLPPVLWPVASYDSEISANARLLRVPEAQTTRPPRLPQAAGPQPTLRPPLNALPARPVPTPDHIPSRDSKSCRSDTQREPYSSVGSGRTASSPRPLQTSPPLCPRPQSLTGLLREQVAAAPGCCQFLRMFALHLNAGVCPKLHAPGAGTEALAGEGSWSHVGFHPWTAWRGCCPATLQDSAGQRRTLSKGIGCPLGGPDHIHSHSQEGPSRAQLELALPSGVWICSPCCQGNRVKSARPPAAHVPWPWVLRVPRPQEDGTAAPRTSPSPQWGSGRKTGHRRHAQPRCSRQQGHPRALDADRKSVV